MACRAGMMRSAGIYGDSGVVLGCERVTREGFLRLRTNKSPTRNIDAWGTQAIYRLAECKK
jgi:hypothetical protein